MNDKTEKEIRQLYQNIISSIDYDDILYKEDEGEWITAISVHFKNANRYIEGFKNANPYSIVRLWTNKVCDYFKDNSCFSLDIRGTTVTAIFKTPKKSDIDGVIYHAAYISSLQELFCAVLEKKNIKQFKIGIGISTLNAHMSKCPSTSFPLVSEAIDLFSVLLSIDANDNGYERILIDETTQFNLADMVCYSDKKYKDVGIKRTCNYASDPIYGYNLNLVNFTSWIESFKKKNEEL